MRDFIEPEPKTALVLRPLLKSMETGLELIRFGGKPRLPEDMTWPIGRYASGSPRPYYFVAEIDFGGLFEALRWQIEPGELPGFPQAGTAFLFCALSGDDIYEADNVKILFTPKGVHDNPGRNAPDWLPDLRQSDAWHIAFDGVSDCGRHLTAQAAEVVAVTAPAACNPLITNMLAARGFDAAEAQLAHAEHEALMTEALDRSDIAAAHPTVRADQMISAYVKPGFNAFRQDPMEWQTVFDWAKAFEINLCDEVERILTEARETEDSDFAEALARCNAWRAALENETFDASIGRGPWYANRLPRPDAPLDVQAATWRQLAKENSGDMTPRMQDTFLALQRAVKQRSDAFRRRWPQDRAGTIGYPLQIAELETVELSNNQRRTILHGANIKAVVSAQRAAFERKLFGRDLPPCTARWERAMIETARSVQQQAKSPNVFTLGEMPLQMFGNGFEVQSAVTDNADKVLLMQLGDACSGIPIQFGAGILQIWIAPDDLAAGRFDQITSTLDCT